ncbi:hypothetical protein RUM43_012435 [Polyplax serrata]|uniref:Trehalase n=1 Tax=Polyplax serrata TaxID=468196 RepID=A0AAN8RSY9_POLSC
MWVPHSIQNRGVKHSKPTEFRYQKLTTGSLREQITIASGYQAKYDAETPGRYGGGGEYIVQAGFGWTNGAIMELLNTYGAELRCTDKDICEMSGPLSKENRRQLDGEWLSVKNLAKSQLIRQKNKELS